MPDTLQKIALFWFRRDLRTDDNTALYHALRSGYPVLPLFIFDRNILDKLEDRDDARVTFIHRIVSQLSTEFSRAGGQLRVFYGKPPDVFEQLTQQYEIAAVYTNHDYDPYAKERDAAIAAFLQRKGVTFHSFKDQVIFERQEVLTGQGNVYTVFTPYSKRWLSQLSDEHLQSYPSAENLRGNLYPAEPQPIPSLADMGFKPSSIEFPSDTINPTQLAGYAESRDFPALPGTTRIGLHLRFGTVSIRQMARLGRKHSATWLNELIWRDFYQMILDNFPRVVTESFKPKYDQIPWRHDEAAFGKWCRGETGYPIVDAGMRQLNASGFMHNRVRMITASFLTKHLLIDWRWGEAYFGRKLLDYELASNNGGWQWAASSGTDAQPYFRIFNPASQIKKFDKDYRYIQQWVPEYGTDAYPKPIIAHEAGRERALKVFRETFRNGE
jgi:deoxyribodipyrimidine photo-lyase